LNSANRSLKSRFTGAVAGTSKAEKGEVPYGVDPFLGCGFLPAALGRSGLARPDDAARDDPTMRIPFPEPIDAVAHQVAMIADRTRDRDALR
jgi:hypothetical protein